MGKVPGNCGAECGWKPWPFVGTMMNLGVNAKFDQPTGLYTFHELKKQLPAFISHGMEGAVLLLMWTDFRESMIFLGIL